MGWHLILSYSLTQSIYCLASGAGPAAPATAATYRIILVDDFTFICTGTATGGLASSSSKICVPSIYIAPKKGKIWPSVSLPSPDFSSFYTPGGMYICLGLKFWLLDIPRFSKELIRSSYGWSVMGKGSDPYGWFVGGWGRRGLAVLLPAAGVVLGPTTLSEFFK